MNRKKTLPPIIDQQKQKSICRLVRTVLIKTGSRVSIKTSGISVFKTFRVNDVNSFHDTVRMYLN
jgi:hypothetical protein